MANDSEETIGGPGDHRREIVYGCWFLVDGLVVMVVLMKVRGTPKRLFPKTASVVLEERRNDFSWRRPPFWSPLVLPRVLRNRTRGKGGIRIQALGREGSGRVGCCSRGMVLDPLLRRLGIFTSLGLLITLEILECTFTSSFYWLLLRATQLTISCVAGKRSQ